MPSDPPDDFTLKPEAWEVRGRYFLVFLLAGLSVFASWPLRVLVWGLLLALLRLGYLAELTPVRFSRGLLYRGNDRRRASEATRLWGPVVLGLWPRFGVWFQDGTKWWLPLGPGWHLLWDALRRENPALPDWRETPLCLYFLVQAASRRARSSVPGELYELAEALSLRNALFPWGWFALAAVGFGLLAWAVAPSSPADAVVVSIALGTIGEAGQNAAALRRLRGVQEGGFCRPG